MIPQFSLQRLRARPLTLEDCTHFYGRFDSKLCQYMPEVAVGNDATNWVKEKLQMKACYLVHVLEDIKENRVVGYVQLINGAQGTIKDRFAIELGYFFFPEFWQQGYGSELIATIVNNIVEHNNWTQEVIAWVYQGNIASAKLLEKNDFFKARTEVDSKGLSKTMYVYQSMQLRRLISNGL